MSSLYLAYLFKDNPLVELRVLNDYGAATGIFDNQIELEKAADTIAFRNSYTGMYTTLNTPVDIGFSHKNQVNTLTRSVKDQDISHIKRIPFDFDAIRHKDTNASTQQVNYALQTAKLLEQWLTQMGWPKPLTAMSGNGAHLQYRCDLKSDATLKKAMQTIYQSLAKLFDSNLVSFDQRVLNPSRIFRLYGTQSRKAPDLPDTPWRTSECTIPDPWKQVSGEAVFALANYLTLASSPVVYLPKPAYLKSSPSHFICDYRTLNIVSLMNDMGIYKRKLGNGKHSIYCPWGTSHSTTSKQATTDTVVFEAKGGTWPQFHCSHNSCVSEDILSLIKHVGVNNVAGYCTKQF